MVFNMFTGDPLKSKPLGEITLNKVYFKFRFASTVKIMERWLYFMMFFQLHQGL